MIDFQEQGIASLLLFRLLDALDVRRKQIVTHELGLASPIKGSPGFPIILCIGVFEERYWIVGKEVPI